ncbi:MAG: hypothetical protein JKY23_04255 [Nitrospinaceae bacterium]|nr:hypothetical protein [Nitrospinaceae bacterium]
MTTFGTDYDGTVFAYVFAGAVLMIISTHLDYLWSMADLQKFLPVDDGSSDGPDDRHFGNAHPFLNVPTGLETVLHLGGHALFTVGCYKSIEPVAVLSKYDTGELRIWVLVSTLAIPAMMILSSFLSGVHRLDQVPLAKMLGITIHNGAWIVLGLFAALNKQSPFNVYAYLGGPLVGVSVLVIGMTRYYYNDISKQSSRMLGSAGIITGFIFLLLAVSRRPI